MGCWSGPLKSAAAQLQAVRRPYGAAYFGRSRCDYCELLAFFFASCRPRFERRMRPPSLLGAVENYVEKKGESERPIFRHSLADLDGDGRADAIVLLLGRA